MFPYNLVFLILILGSLFEFSYSNKQLFIHKKCSKIFFFVAILFLYFFAAFRFEVGRDWQNYIRYFNNCTSPEILSGREKLGWEFGYGKLNQLFKFFFDDFYIMQIFIITFSEICIFKSIEKNSKFICFSLLLYVFFYYFKTDMAQTRQHIAMAVLISGNKFIKEKKIFPWIGTVIVAMMFHVTAIIALPLYFTSRIIIKSRLSICLFCFAVYITYFGSPLIILIISLVSKLSFIPTRISLILAMYIRTLNISRFSSSGLGILGRYIFIAFTLLIYIIKNDKSQNYYYFNFLIGVIFNAMGQNFAELTRVANYYFICGGGLYAYNLLIDSKNFYKKVDFLRISGCIAFIIFNCIAFNIDWYLIDNRGSSFYLDYTPYQSIFER